MYKRNTPSTLIQCSHDEVITFRVLLLDHGQVPDVLGVNSGVLVGSKVNLDLIPISELIEEVVNLIHVSQ